MSNELQLFNFKYQPVRVVMINGEPWWVATDVCRILEITNVSQAVASLDDDEKGICNIYTPGGNQKMRCVTEPGLYGLVLVSRKPEAKAFKRWLKQEVLPSIRKTGSYSTSDQIQRIYPWTVEAEQLRQLNMKYIQPGYFSIAEVVLQKLIYEKLEGITPNERAKIDISAGQFFSRHLKRDRKGQLKDCPIYPEHSYDKSKIKRLGHVVDSETKAVFDVCHYANLYRGDFDNLWDLWYKPVILPAYLSGLLPDGTPRVVQSTDIQKGKN